jgi:hypothetical protein
MFKTIPEILSSCILKTCPDHPILFASLSSMVLNFKLYLVFLFLIPFRSLLVI